ELGGGAGRRVTKCICGKKSTKRDFADAVTGKPWVEFYFHLSTAEEGFADLIADKAEFVLLNQYIM
ncbi:MAG: hypothetical protein P8M25_14395, partial [Paracoccaceae bacterium]|nr:hypothetical protein [Paracoccaceae bacterium]